MDIRAIYGYAEQRNSDEWHARYLAILMTRLMGGRSGEVAFMATSSVRWDREAGMATVWCNQRKKNKAKLVVLGAGSDSALSWFSAVGNVLTVQAAATDDADPLFLCTPHLRDVGQPGTLVGRWMKEAAEALPPGTVTENPTAGGIRPGVINSLLQEMPVEFIVAVTGHDMTSKSAMYEYVDGSIAMNIPGARSVAGWHNSTGNLHAGVGRPPAPACLIAGTGGMGGSAPTKPQLHAFVDTLFHIGPAAAGWRARMVVGGDLRPLAMAAAADLVMNYRRRHLTGGGACAWATWCRPFTGPSQTLHRPLTDR
jgi:hypothetical protein